MSQYKRVLVKLSGEALSGDSGFGIESSVVERFGEEIKAAQQAGVQIGVVVGGGNFFRGIQEEAKGSDRVNSDYMGMLATVINGMAMRDILNRMGIPAQTYSALQIDRRVCPFFNHEEVRQDLDNGKTLIFSGGTSNPYFSTDSAAALRAAEIKADVLIKATKVDGVYDKDPKKHEDAVRYEKLSFSEMLDKRLAVMDSAAVAVCRENQIPIRVFDFTTHNELKSLLAGQPIGTLVEEK